jgi:hypothetical protein
LDNPKQVLVFLSRVVEDVASAIDERPDFQGQKATFLVHGGGKS